MSENPACESQVILSGLIALYLYAKGLLRYWDILSQGSLARDFVHRKKIYNAESLATLRSSPPQDTSVQKVFYGFA